MICSTTKSRCERALRTAALPSCAPLQPPDPAVSPQSAQTRY
eukprot:gene27350-2449_t